jgi:hypothetical protein
MGYNYSDEQFWEDQECHPMAYEIVNHAMTVVGEYDLKALRTALDIASTFVCEELEELPDTTEELGLDKWLQNEMDEQAESEEMEREQVEDE